MAKFTTDYVNLIANNLRDRYKTGFPVLKELVQNADDAGATSLAFGYHSGLSESADHELLAGPALWILNNGRFTASDRQAIKSFGVNSKAAESGAIGKFGLGMKSVFHLCEAFFYVASDGQKPFNEVLSPWFQDNGMHEMHARWEAVSDRDLQALNAAAVEHRSWPDGKSWFMLWVPLRRKVHVPLPTEWQPTAPIIDRYPGDANGKDLDFFTETDIERRIGSLLPLLRHLQRFHFVGTDSVAPFDLQVELHEDSQRLDHITHGLKVRGSVLDSGPKTSRLHFVATQTVLRGVERFSRLQSANGWPKSMASTLDGMRMPVPDKGQPEGAVVISHADKRRGQLTLQWAVFLPTEEGRYRYQAEIPNSSREYSLTLHGQFFVDAGRRGIEGMDRLGEPIVDALRPSMESAVPLAWNQTLAQELILPRVLPALAEYVEAEKLTDAQVIELTEAMVRSAAVGDSGAQVRFVASFIRHLCRNHAWVRTLRPDGAQWELVPTDTKMLPLPRPVAGDHQRPWRSLPGLQDFSGFRFVDSQAPNISLSTAQWSEEQVAAALARMPIETLTGEVELKYLIEFLCVHKDRALNTARVQYQLVRLIRAVLQRIPLSEVRAHRQHFKQLLELLPMRRRFGLGTRTTDAKGSVPERLYQQLIAVESQALLVPADLAPDGEDPGHPTINDVEAWLIQVDHSIGDDFDVGSCLGMAEYFLKAIKGNAAKAAQPDLLRRFPMLRILRAIDVRTDKEIATSLEALHDSHGKHLLFRSPDPKSRLGLTTHLAAAAPELELWVLGGETSRIFQQAMLQGAPNLPGTDDASAMFECLGEQAIAPRLGNISSRTGLLDHVGSADLTKPAVRDGVRYLLHGQPDRFKFSGTLWKNPSGQDSPWVRLWRMISDDTWNVLPGELSGQIPDKCSLQLDIKAVEQATVTAKLRVVTSFDAVDAHRFSEAELSLILGQVEDETAWRKLPLHRDVRGTFGPVSGNCYLGSHPEMPSGVGANLRFIVEADDEAHRRRQEQFITKWSPAQAAVTVLRSGDAVGHWCYLMDRLQEMSLPVVPTTGAWKDVAWLPIVSGGSISPSSLIQLDGLETDVSALAAMCEFAYAGIPELLSEVQAHPGFGKLKSLIPSGPDALPVLGELMANADMKVGAAVMGASEDFLGRHGTLLCSLSSLPAWTLISKAAQVTSHDDVVTRLLRAVALPLELQHAEAVLQELTDKVLDPGKQGVYFTYLREWAKADTAARLRDRLAKMKLLSLSGEWRPAAELAHGALGIEPENCVHPEVGEVLSGIIATNNSTPLEPMAGNEQGSGSANADLESVIERWCESFSQSSVQPAIGALIGLFGISVKALAERWLAPIAYTDYLLKLNWKDPGYEDGPDRRMRWMGGNSSFDRPFTLLKTMFVESSVSKVRVKSLIGKEVDIPLASTESMSTLLAGPLNWLGGYGVEVRMRPMEYLRNFDLSRQKDILQRTAEELLRHFYGQDRVNLTGLWALFDEADQLELDIARSLILDGLPQLLAQLPKVKKHPLLAEAFAAVDQGRREIASARRARSNLQLADDLFKGAIDDLANLVGSNDSVQQAVLNGIRKKIEGYQYERSSIPFEILQNADDAVVEYQEMQRADGRSQFRESEIGRFVIAGTEQGLMLMHWGRPINYMGRHQNHRAEYAKDLERMLMLGASAKEVEDGVTGKFGLGFKSVLLATDRPVVSSGDLHFEIVAGCLPQRAELSPSAKQRAAQYKRESLRPTVLELSITPVSDRDELVQRFTSLAGLCAVFTRQIRHIEVHGVTHSWSPDRLLSAANAWCELGQVLVPSKHGLVTSRLLIVRSKLGAMAIRMDAHAVPFDHGADHPVPAIWVTEPTRGTAASGVVLNADFKIDTGRSGLAQGGAVKRNLETARQLADSLTPAFDDLLEQTRADWTAWSGRMTAASQTTVVKYWHTIWSVMFGKDLSEDASQDAQLAAAFVQRLFSRIIERSGVVPNGLPGELAAFVQHDQLRLAIPCSRLQAVLPLLSAWPAFASLYPCSAWCGDDVAGWIREHQAADDGLETLDRAAVFNALGLQKKLDSVDMPHLAAVINAWPKGPTEDQGWRNELAKIQLKSRSGVWKPASSLHLGALEQDDLLARFVPDDCLLDEAYQAQSAAWGTVSQYLAPKDFQPQDLARWCLDASTEERRRAVLRWLSQHLDSRPVWKYIECFASDNAWIFSLHAGHSLLSDLDHADQVLVLSLLGLTAENDSDDMQVYHGLAVTLDLEAIHGWWLEHRKKYLPKYDQALWPQRVDRSKLSDDSVDRETWMTLFSLGIFRRFGRVRDEQNRAFLDFLHSRGWWFTISEIHPDSGAEEWMSILKEYAETNQVTGEFEQWMDSFPRLYRLARWCEDYAELFRGLQFRDKTEAKHLLTPATDSSLSGSGFDAPTIHRTLRIGHNLVVRELLRTGVLNSEVAQSMAFMPGRAVMDFLQQMGYTDLERSQDIHAVLVDKLGSAERASFGGDYDIPFILLAGNGDLQREVAAWADQQAQAEYENDLLEEEET